MATPTSTIEHIEYRVVMLCSGSREVLAVRSENGNHQPLRVSLPAYTRMAPRLHRALQTGWGLHGMILDLISEHDAASPCVVVELFTEPVPATLHPISLDKIASSALSAGERAAISKMQDDTTSVPFARPGWIEDAITWVEDTTGERVLSKLEIEQYNAGGAFALIRFPMKGGQAYWFKATGEPNAHEMPMSCLLAKLCAGYVPNILAVHPSWNAWLMEGTTAEAAEHAFTPGDTLRKLEYAVEGLAELQIRTLGHETDLFAAGAFDQRVATLRTHSTILFERIREAMMLQTSTKAARIEGLRLHNLHASFDRACEVIEELDIPPTLIHGDMNAGNVVYRNGRCQFIDWCEAYVGLPLVTLQHLLLLNRPDRQEQKVKTDPDLVARYCAVIGKVCPATVQKRTIACMPLLAAASAMYGRGDWFGNSLHHAPQRQAYVRTLARYMDQAAQAGDLIEAIGSRSSTGPIGPDKLRGRGEGSHATPSA
jgi:hypothetical protein